MEELTEKFIIKITKSGLVIDSMAEKEKKTISFTAGEALMLLDILKNEESNLKQILEDASPLAIQINP